MGLRDPFPSSRHRGDRAPPLNNHMSAWAPAVLRVNTLVAGLKGAPGDSKGGASVVEWGGVGWGGLTQDSCYLFTNLYNIDTVL